jgi:hypothetical protein
MTLEFNEEELEKIFGIRPIPKMDATRAPSTTGSVTETKKIVSHRDGTQTAHYATPVRQAAKPEEERAIDYRTMNPIKSKEEKKKIEDNAQTVVYEKEKNKDQKKKIEAEAPTIVYGRGKIEMKQASIHKSLEQMSDKLQEMLSKVEHPDLSSMSGDEIHNQAREIINYADPSPQHKDRLKAIIHHPETPMKTLKHLSEHDDKDISGSAQRMLTKRPQRDHLKAKEAGSSPEVAHARAKIANETGKKLGMNKCSTTTYAEKSEAFEWSFDELAKTLNKDSVSLILQKAVDAGQLSGISFMNFRNFGDFDIQSATLIKGVFSDIMDQHPEIKAKVKNLKGDKPPVDEDKAADKLVTDVQKGKEKPIPADVDARIAQAKAGKPPKPPKSPELAEQQIVDRVVSGKKKPRK